MSIEFYRSEDKPTTAENISCLVYGPAGSGKTFFAGSAGSRTLWLDLAGGMLTIHSPVFKQKYGVINPLIARIRENINEQRLVETPEAFNHCCDAIDEALENHSDEFDTVVLDDITTLRKFAIHMALKVNLEEDRSKTKTKKRVIIVPAVQDYGEEMKHTEWFLWQYEDILKKAKKNFIVLAHERYVFAKKERIGDPDTAAKIRPGFTGKSFPDDVTGLFDFVWHAERAGAGENAIYRFRMYGDEVNVGKSRMAVFNNLEPDPNFQSFLKRVRDAQPAVKPSISKR